MSEGAAGQEPIDLASVFLGPKGENAEVFEQLLLDSLRDHVFWRRNFHPEDGFLVGELDKHRPGYERSISILRQELLGLLSELKAGVPSFSPRYIGHMCPDPTMASMVGYFATMLYNPNNVAAETSPVTTRMELEVADQLAALVGFPANRHWGHLTSGGTVANFEALWVARNVKYLPVAIHWAAAEAHVDPAVQLADGSSADISRLTLWELLNIAPECALDLADEFRKQVGDPAEAGELLKRHSLAGLGYQQFGGRLATEFRDSLPPAVVLVPSTAHYSWEKICRSLGIGGSNLLQVAVDSRFRMDHFALEELLERLSAERRPVMACVAVIGTTEESAVDRLDQVVRVRERAAREWGLTFHLHADAAYGGYATTVTRQRGGSRRSFSATRAAYAPEEWPEPEVYDALCALESIDSITVDPHKLGFVPYPAGAITMRDRRARDLVAVDAPYVFHRGASEWGYIGRYIFEGSKPGAAAAGVWMSHKVLPLDAEGYGHLIGQTAKGARRLHRRLGSGEWDEFRVVSLPPPDLNIVCFTVGHPRLVSLDETNRFVDRLYMALRIGDEPGAPVPDYLVTKTVLRAAEYGEAVAPLIDSLGFPVADYQRAGGLSVIRCTVMDPFLVEVRGKRDHIEEFASTLLRTMRTVLDDSG